MAHRTKRSMDEADFLSFRRGDRREDLQELRCARVVTWAMSGRSGTPLFFEVQVRVDMRYVSPKDVKKMYLAGASSGERRQKRCGLASIVMSLGSCFWKEFGFRKRLFDIGWSNESKCQACHKEGTEKHRLYHCPGWNEVRREIPEVFRKREQKARTSKK